MEIVFLKNFIYNFEYEYLSLLDEDCRVYGNVIYYSLFIDIIQCGIKLYVYKNFIVYINRVMEFFNEDFDVIIYVGVKEIFVLFSCYYNDLEIVFVVGYKLVVQKIYVYV